MTLKLKLLLISLIVGLFTAATAWLSHQRINDNLNSVHQSNQTQESNRIQNLTRSFLNQYLTTSQKLTAKENLNAIFEDNNLATFIETLNIANDEPVEFLAYSAKQSKVFRSHPANQGGSFFDLESTILAQMKSPSIKTAVAPFDGERALVRSSAILRDGEVLGVVLAVLPLNQSFIEHLKVQTDAEFHLKVANKTYTTNDTLDWTSAEVISWPVQTDKDVQIKFFNPLVTEQLIYGYTGQFELIIIFVLMVALVVAVYVIAQNFTKYIRKMNEVVDNADNALQLSAGLKNLNLSSELSNLTQGISLLIGEQNNQNRQLQSQIKQQEKILNDIKTEKQSLLKERDSAVKAPRTKSEFLSRMGDEITTPMKTLSSMLHLLSEYNLEEEPKELLSISRRSANTLINNLNNILDFSKLDANLLKLYKDNFDIRQLIDEIVAEYTPHAKAKSLTISATVANEVPESVYNDPKRVKQILKNLIGNAIRFTKEGEVSLYCDLVMENSNEFLRLTVKDSGVGIPEEAQKGLFDSLEQRTKLTNSSFAGRLRLIVSKKLSELMGGNIGVNSEPKKGSRFWFTVSLHKN